ncbi:MAG: RecQ family ATP-dependent DNA helicase [Gaiellales bacterium]
MAERLLADVAAGRTKLVYCTPERLRNTELCDRLAAVGVSLLAVDEAHCISQWGNRFRPAYLELGRIAQRLGRPTIEAVTATATPFVREDIHRVLDLPDPLVVVEGNDRPNLFLEVHLIHQEAEDRSEVLKLADQLRGQGIVYTRTTAAARETAAWLEHAGHSAQPYHGRMRKPQRDEVQRSFTEGRTRIVAATNAFGLGVDKHDVRWVVHRDVPASLEAYWQEAGRAGGDGRPARCVLLYRPGDLSAAAFNATAAGEGGDRRARQRGLLEMMRGYAETDGCRRRYILNYLGEEFDPSRCQMCDRSIEATRPETVPAPLGMNLGDRVRHTTFGDGVVQRLTRKTVTVLFDTGTYRKLRLGLALEGKLAPIDSAVSVAHSSEV